MKVLFATTNPAKIKRYAEKLKEKNIDVLTIKDLEINLKPEETGKNAIENAYIKAKAYYDETKIITISMDNNLYIEELPKEKQPGTHVRRVNGKELNDDEMIEYYGKLSNEIKKLPDYFVQIHNSYIINLNALKMSSNDYVIMNNDNQISISRKYAETFKNRMFSRWKKINCED